MRQRTDKSANALNTAESILQTINDPVTQEELQDLLEDLTPESFGCKVDEDFDKEAVVLGKR